LRGCLRLLTAIPDSRVDAGVALDLVGSVLDSQPSAPQDAQVSAAESSVARARVQAVEYGIGRWRDFPVDDVKLTH